MDRQVAEQISRLIETVDSSAASGDMSGAAVSAVEIYRLLVGQFEQRLATTRAVAMLDYSGFRLLGLAGADHVNWIAIAATVQEAGENWAGTRRHLKDKVLSDLGNTIQTGLDAAAMARNLNWLRSLAQIQLDTVDLLERVVKNHAQGACI